MTILTYYRIVWLWLIAVKCALSHIDGGWLTKNKSTFKLRIVLRIRIDGSWT